MDAVTVFEHFEAGILDGQYYALAEDRALQESSR